ncbi:hypothetical protein EKA14_07780 [Bacillus mycoides]|nr:hypothetical protein EKA14_07780 [Bacillus mycoides]
MVDIVVRIRVNALLTEGISHFHLILKGSNISLFSRLSKRIRGWIGDLSRYLRAVKLPTKNSAGTKKLVGSRAAHKRPIGAGY